ncbi:hypothetical protein MMC14_001851 [Varicellaria rhodocarpa]|nr:hypothetical protein [Varicellaria rhodocarpa]
MVKRLAKDCLQALEYLHSKGVCHGNIHPTSFIIYHDIDPYDESKVLDLFRLSGSGDPYDDDEYPYDQGEEPYDQGEDPYDQADDESYLFSMDPYKEAVREFVITSVATLISPISTELNLTCTTRYDKPYTAPLRIRLGGFRRAFSSDKPSLNTKPLRKLLYPLPPELVFGEPVGPPLDIWSLGPIIGSVVSGIDKYENFLCNINGRDESPSEYLLFAQTLLGEMSLEFQARLDPAARKPDWKPESFQCYLRRDRAFYPSTEEDGLISDKISDKEY